MNASRELRMARRMKLLTRCQQARHIPQSVRNSPAMVRTTGAAIAAWQHSQRLSSPYPKDCALMASAVSAESPLALATVSRTSPALSLRSAGGLSWRSNEIF